jgi:hypothetical protein
MGSTVQSLQTAASKAFSRSLGVSGDLIDRWQAWKSSQTDRMYHSVRFHLTARFLLSLSTALRLAWSDLKIRVCLSRVLHCFPGRGSIATGVVAISLKKTVTRASDVRCQIVEVASVAWMEVVVVGIGVVRGDALHCPTGVSRV